MENLNENLIFGFEKLEIWQLSMDLSVDIYHLSRVFPIEEKYDLTSQINRSSGSVPSNIAEGTSRFSKNDKARFLQYSYTSNLETMNNLIRAYRIGYISKEVCDGYRPRIKEIANKINAYYKSIFDEKIQ